MFLNLDKSAKIAEILSGIAVLITLVILIVEIRENTEITRVSSYYQLTDRFNEWRYFVLENPDQFELYWSYINGDANQLSELDRARGRMLFQNLWTDTENAYFANDYTILGIDEWEMITSNACANFEIISQYSEEWIAIRSRLTSEFAQYIDSECN